ncbi:MAG: hypothetical protein ACFFDS_05380 [Candidatus Thorarchaeota archaeon]
MTDHDISEEEYSTATEMLDETIHWSEVVFHTLFELQKKYSRFIKRKEVVGVKESEGDRERVSDAYLYLKNQKENLVDSALYKDFIDMSELREISYLENLLHPEKRLDDFALTVTKLCQAIVFTEGETRIDSRDLVSFLNNESKDIEFNEDIEQFMQHYQDYFIPLKTVLLTRSEVMNIEDRIYNMLIDKKIKKNELNVKLTSVEAEILSKMISEKKIFVTMSDDELFFSSDEVNDSEAISSSVLISPKKNNNNGDE